MRALRSTVLLEPLDEKETVVHIASQAGIQDAAFGQPRSLLYVDRECLEVLYFAGGALGSLIVRRCGLGTYAAKHLAGATVWFGGPSDFHTHGPNNTLSDDVAEPYIDVHTGTMWVKDSNGKWKQE